MKGATQNIDLSIKKPKQSRAKLTVSLIFESTARIIQREGLAKLTTNRIAEVAGVSVGTLYQYFRNKEAILLAMATEKIEQMKQQIALQFAVHGHDSVAVLAEGLLGFLMHIFELRGGLRRSITQSIFRVQAMPNMYPVVIQVEQQLAACLLACQCPDKRSLDEAEAYVISRSLIGVLRAAMLEQSSLNGSDLLHQALKRQFIYMLQQPPQA